MANTNVSRNILVAPLNWGLGHATRCFPIIQQLEVHGFTPIIASDGMALELLQREFAHLIFFELPGYGITYPENGRNFRFKMLQALPKVIRAISAEKKMVEHLHLTYNFDGVISDNRFGVLLKDVPSIYVTHQIRVSSGSTTFLSSFFHQKIIQKFTECWIPDFENAPNLSFALGHQHNSLKKKYIGPLSRFTKDVNQTFTWEIIVVLSGPEPQRSLLQQLLFESLQEYDGRVLMVFGKIEVDQNIQQHRNVTIYNYMTSGELENAIQQSRLVICRSGYTSVMDLWTLQKQCFFIPTPGQFEQEYLAEMYQKNGIAPFCKQADFTLEQLKRVDDFSGFQKRVHQVDWSRLFSVFDRE